MVGINHPFCPKPSSAPRGEHEPPYESCLYCGFDPHNSCHQPPFVASEKQTMDKQTLIDNDTRRIILDHICEGKDDKALEVFLHEVGLGDPTEPRLGVIIGLSSNGYGGYGNGSVHPGQTITIVARPQTSPFKGCRFAVTRNTGDRFTIDDLRIGNHSMFPQAQSLPAEMFATEIADLGMLEISGYRGSQGVEVRISDPAIRMFGRAVRMDTCQTAMDITVIVTNISKQPWPFQGFILGYGVEFGTSDLNWDQLRGR